VLPTIGKQSNYCLLCTAVYSCVRRWFNWLFIDWWKHNWLTSIKLVTTGQYFGSYNFLLFLCQHLIQHTRSVPSAYHYTSQWFTAHPVFNHLCHPHPLHPTSCVGTLLGLFDPEDESTTLVENVGNYTPNNIVLQPRRLEFSTAPL